MVEKGRTKSFSIYDLLFLTISFKVPKSKGRTQFVTNVEHFKNKPTFCSHLQNRLFVLNSEIKNDVLPLVFYVP